MNNESFRYRWWHALLFGLATNAISALSLQRDGAEEQFYQQQVQAPFAPPAWVFGPAWGVNNVSVLWGNLRLLNMPDSPRRRALLWLQGASWALYSTFSYVYFRKHSPLLALLWTSSMYVLTIASAIVAWKIDRKITWSFLTLLVWLSIATPTAIYQALYNEDPLFNTAPLAD